MLHFDLQLLSNSQVSYFLNYCKRRAPQQPLLSGIQLMSCTLQHAVWSLTFCERKAPTVRQQQKSPSVTKHTSCGKKLWFQCASLINK